MSSIRLFPARRRSVSLLLRRQTQPPADTVRLCVSLGGGGACLNRALLYRCSLNTTRESWVFLPDAPRTTRLSCHDEALRPHAAAKRYHSLRVSQALDPPERRTPLAKILMEHVSQHALPRQPAELSNIGSRRCQW